MINLRAVKELTGLDIHKVYELQIVEFINYMCFIIDETNYLNNKNKQAAAKIKKR